VAVGPEPPARQLSRKLRSSSLVRKLPGCFRIAAAGLPLEKNRAPKASTAWARPMVSRAVSHMGWPRRPSGVSGALRT
jgi:hypothetical protein